MRESTRIIMKYLLSFCRHLSIHPSNRETERESKLWYFSDLCLFESHKNSFDQRPINFNWFTGTRNVVGRSVWTNGYECLSDGWMVGRSQSQSQVRLWLLMFYLGYFTSGFKGSIKRWLSFLLHNDDGPDQPKIKGRRDPIRRRR